MDCNTIYQELMEHIERHPLIKVRYANKEDFEALRKYLVPNDHKEYVLYVKGEIYIVKCRRS